MTTTTPDWYLKICDGPACTSVLTEHPKAIIEKEWTCYDQHKTVIGAGSVVLLFCSYFCKDDQNFVDGVK